MSGRSVLLALVVVVFTSCGDRRCTLRPPRDADYGPCDLSMPHWAYIAEEKACANTSGCRCDAECQANELPFSSREECEAACVPQEEPPPIVPARGNDTFNDANASVEEHAP